MPAEPKYFLENPMPMMKTRSKEPESTLNPSKCLNNEAHDPLRLMILPKDTSPAARICTLSHPRTSIQCRYYFCPEKGIYEFTRVAAPRSACQSWLLSRQHRKAERLPNGSSLEQSQDQPIASFKPTDHAEERLPPRITDGYIIKTPELLVATPIDPLFLLLPALHDKSIAKSNSSKGLFLSADDILESLEETSKHFNEVSTHSRIRQSMESRMEAVCDTVDAGDETMFRLNKEKLLAELVTKARRMVELGLPASMEDRFVSRALVRPVAALKRKESSISASAQPSAIELPVVESATTVSVDSQTSTTTSLSTDTEASIATELTIPDQEGEVEGPNECRNLFRLRIALTYMMSSYIPQPLAAELNAMLASAESPIDFIPLDEELEAIAKIRSEALASRSMSDFSRKRGMDDDEAAERRAEKKARKEEEEKKKKAGETRGIRDLKKVDTTGMKKMSDFFGKALATKKKKS